MLFKPSDAFCAEMGLHSGKKGCFNFLKTMKMSITRTCQCSQTGTGAGSSSGGKAVRLSSGFKKKPSKGSGIFLFSTHTCRMTHQGNQWQTRRTYLVGQPLLSMDQLNGRSFDSTRVVSSSTELMRATSAANGRGNRLLQLAQNKVSMQRAICQQPDVQMGTEARSPFSGKGSLTHGRRLRLTP